MKWVLLAALLVTTQAQAVSWTDCIRRFVKAFIVADWPKTRIVENGLNPWVPVRRQVTRDRIMRDFVDTNQLTLVDESERRILFRSKMYDWTIAFLRDETGAIRMCDVGGMQEESKKFWLGRTLNSRGLLEYYFDEKYIVETEVCPNEKE
jgi:hypothetical protein